MLTSTSTERRRARRRRLQEKAGPCPAFSLLRAKEKNFCVSARARVLVIGMLFWRVAPAAARSIAFAGSTDGRAGRVNGTLGLFARAGGRDFRTAKNAFARARTPVVEFTLFFSRHLPPFPRIPAPAPAKETATFAVQPPYKQARATAAGTRGSCPRTFSVSHRSFSGFDVTFRSALGVKSTQSTD